MDIKEHAVWLVLFALAIVFITMGIQGSLGKILAVALIPQIVEINS